MASYEVVKRPTKNCRIKNLFLDSKKLNELFLSKNLRVKLSGHVTKYLKKILVGRKIDISSLIIIIF